VLRATRPGYLLRALGFVIGTLSVFRWIIVGMRLFAVQTHTDRETLREGARETVRLMNGYPLWSTLFSYLRPGFHPDEVGSIDAALAQLRAEGLDPA
jgi:predicted metal-dependent hydrolase